MRKLTLILSMVLAVFFSTISCNKKEITLVKRLPVVQECLANSDKITILYYSDTRSGVLSNWNQKVHKQFINKVLENEKSTGIKYLLFGGDNVLFGFLDIMWERFFNIMKIYQTTYPEIKIYPGLGNHELILSQLLFDRLSKYEEYQGFTYEDFIGKLKKELGENYEFNENAEPSIFIKDMFVDSHGSLDVGEESEDSIYYKALNDSEKVSTEISRWGRFKKYVNKWAYLKEIPNINDERTYYSFTLPIGKSDKSVKIIVLDSSGSSFSDVQEKWYENELKFTEGPVFTMCHHPIFDFKNSPKIFKNWNVPPQLFLVGHKHEYERHSKNGSSQIPPFHIVSASGGVPLRNPDGLPSCLKGSNICDCGEKAYNYCRITICNNPEEISIKVIVFGCKKIEDDFTVIDQLEFNWK